VWGIDSSYGVDIWHAIDCGLAYRSPFVRLRAQGILQNLRYSHPASIICFSIRANEFHQAPVLANSTIILYCSGVSDVQEMATNE